MDSPAKGTPIDRGSRSVPIAAYGNEPQFPPSSNHHLMPSLRGPEHFSFGPSFWNTHDENKCKTDAADSDNPTDRQHSLPAQDYQNVIKGSRNTKNDRKTG